MYSVKGVFYTLQGEGLNAGRGAVFCRFVYCNLDCAFCDTDFTPRGMIRVDATELANLISSEWGSRGGQKLVVFTGGEPALQLTTDLVRKVKAKGFQVAIETNGTRPIPDVDWVCVSPKDVSKMDDVVVRSGDELKVAFPQALDMDMMRGWSFEHFWVVPIEDENLEANTRAAVEFCWGNPGWRLGLQMHKIIGVD